MAARNIAEIDYDIAEAFEYIHSQGVVHRDVKPSNILLVDYGNAARRARAKLTDFGIAVADVIERITFTGVTTGTAGYLSPEQAAGEPVGPPDQTSIRPASHSCSASPVRSSSQEPPWSRRSRDSRGSHASPTTCRHMGRRALVDDGARSGLNGLLPASSSLWLRQVAIAESGRHKEEAFFDTRRDAQQTDVIDTIPNEALHRITAMAARLFSAPISVVSINADNRTWLVSHYGDEVEQIVRQIDLSGPGAPRDEPFIVEDALARPDTRNRPSRSPRSESVSMRESRSRVRMAARWEPSPSRIFDRAPSRTTSCRTSTISERSSCRNSKSARRVSAPDEPA